MARTNKSGKKVALYKYTDKPSKYKGSRSNGNNKSFVFCCRFYFINGKGNRQVLVRDSDNSKLVKKVIKQLLAEFIPSTIIGYVIEKRYRDGRLNYSYKRTLENWDKYMTDFYEQYPNAKFLGYINKDRTDYNVWE